MSALVAAVAAVGNAEGVSLLPPALHAQSVEVAGAATQAGIASPRAGLIQVSEPGRLNSLTMRALLLGELVTTPPVLDQVAHEAGISTRLLSGSTSYIQNIPEQMLGPDLEVRANEILDDRAPYHLNIQPDPNVPRFAIYARAPSAAEAERLANAAVPALRAFLRADALSHGIDPANQLQVEQLGPPRGAVVNAHAKVYIIGLTFLAVFGLCGALLVGAPRIRRGWNLAAGRRRSDGEGTEPDPLGRANVDPGVLRQQQRLVAHPLTLDSARGALPARLRQPRSRLVTRRRHAAIAANAGGTLPHVADDWPHTRRLLPWMIAAFLLILWLVPFDQIQIGSALPVDLKFDRIVLPIVVIVWLLAIAAGGRMAPRLRMTWIHAAVFTFAAFAWLSIVLNVHYLNQNLLLDQGVKRLALLVAFVTFFVVMASTVRRSEIAAFLRYTLVLAVLAAVGTIIEYRFQYNVFYDLAHRLLPGFHVGAAASSTVDDLGRRVVRGPADLPLEAVGMFTLALPIALVGIMNAVRWRQRLLYGLAAALLVAAAISTERKSGMLGPLAVVLTLAFFRRRQLLRLAPLALGLVLVVKVAAPGAIGAVAGQLAPSQLGVATVDDRVIRYDAIRPDVWLHLAFGRGFGTYNVRILDNDVLSRLIEGGVLGLGAYLLMLLSLVVVAAGPIRRREPVSETIGLVAASAAVGVLVLSALYDLTAFPHNPYILLFLAGLLAVAVKSARPTEPSPRTKSPPVREKAWSF